MPKAVLSNRIFMEADRELIDSVRKKLTYQVPNPQPGMPPIIIRNMGMFKKGIITMPIGRLDLIPEGYEIVDKRVLQLAEFPQFMGTLRPSQQEIYEEVEDNMMLNAWVSFGKTFTALAIAGKLKQKTLVVTHTIQLRNQWVKEVEKVYGFTPGIIGSGKFETDSPIVIGNIQTLYKSMDKVSKLFGLVVLDECLDYNSRVYTREGEKTIGTIVNGKKFVDVLSYNLNTREFEWKPILRHFRSKCEDLMIKFKFDSNSVLKCTLNHSVYSYTKGKVAAEYLNVGDYVLSKKSHKTSSLLTEEAKPLLLGMILGDGHLSANGTSVRLCITQGEAQFEYLMYKMSLLKGAFKALPNEGKSGYKPTNSIYNVSSLSFHDLDKWKSILYNNSNNKNCITKDIADMLTVDSWAIMYQDDGSINSERYVQFSFCELDKESMDNLLESLHTLFGIVGTQFVCKKGFRYLYLNHEATRIFIENIAHLIHPVLEYKKGRYALESTFIGSKPVKMFEEYTVQKIVEIDFKPATGGHKFNIEVADNHNYLAGGKLVGNCHHISAATFSRVLDRSQARYKIGLSGTLKRKDGKDVVFQDYFGMHVIRPPAENYMPPEIHVYKTGFYLPDDAAWANRVTKLTTNVEYQHSIAGIAKHYADKGHSVLLVSDRVEFLQTCAQLIGDDAVCITGNIGHADREELMEQIGCGSKKVLCGTQSMFSEGISINRLSCLILGTPLNNDPLLIQLIGRVIREQDGKIQPVVVDINLRGNTPRNQASGRIGLYMQQGWEIKHF